MKLTKSFIFCLLSVLFLAYAQAQDVAISGKVIDESGLPIPGATILIKGTSNAAITDLDGNYQIKAASSGTLVFSYVGYTSAQEAIKGRKSINVKMKPSMESLEEVVVVGYGVQKKSVNTGAISSVKAKDLEKIPNGRIEQALQGRVSGVTVAAQSGQPGAASTVRIRGITTFDTNSGNNPLWVIDGVIVDSGAIGFVNQSDIESMEVLKDAASLAIYGARAASGVILVTTKKGKSGKFTIGYNGFVGVSGPAKTLKLLNATQYGAIMNEKAGAAGQAIPYPNLVNLGAGTDWQKQIFSNNAMKTNHELSLSGGNDVSTFYASFGISDQEGIVSKEISNYGKKSIRLNSSHKLNKLFTIGQTLGFTHQKTVGLGNTNSEFGGPLSSAINLDPTTPVVVLDPVAAAAAIYTNNAYALRDDNGNPYGISTPVVQEITNPVAYVKTRLGNYNWSDDFVGNAFLEMKPIKDLQFRTSVGFKRAFWGSESFTPIYFLSNNVNTTKNGLSRSTNETFSWNIENTVSYKKVIGDHDFSILLGQGAYVDNNTSGTTVNYQNLPTNNYYDASFNSKDVIAADKIGSAYTNQEHHVSSLFSRLNYDFKQKYLFTGIIRRDGSTNFGSNNQYGIFPSFSTGWVISKEGFWKANDVVSSLKLRAGYGVTGNDAIGENGFLALIGGGRNYAFGGVGTTVSTGNSPDAPANPDLKWEETAQLNIGFDTKLFRDFTLTMEYYEKKTTGILQYVDLPGYLGANDKPKGNVADMSNKGFELELGYRKKFGNFNFSANGNVATLKNEVTYIGLGKEFIDGSANFQSMGQVTRTAVGQAYNSFYGYKTAGIFQNLAEVNAYKNAAGGLIQPNAVPGDFRWTDTNGDGAISDADKDFLGTSIPKVTFGLTINLEYKNWDFMAFAQGATGNKIFQGLRRLDIPDANYQTEVLSRWTGEGTSNSYPRVTNSDTNGNFGKMSDFYLEDGDYIRLKVVQLGYSLPSNVVSKMGASRLKFYVTAENLLTLTKYTGYDPEIGGDVSGIDKGFYPQARTFVFGVNVQF